MKFSKYNIFVDNEDNTYLMNNTLTGAMFKVDGLVKDNILNSKFEAFSEKELQVYKQQGIIVEDSVQEERFLSYFYQKSKYVNNVLSLTALLTMDCNLQCSYCFQGAKNKDKSFLTDATREKIYKFIVDFTTERKLDVVSILLFGGEPLLHFNKNIEWLDKIKKYCDENNKKFVTSIVTNGILIDDEILDSLKKYDCQTIQITLDGIPSIHNTKRIFRNKEGSFTQVLEGIKKVKNKQGLNNPVIRINIDKNNIGTTLELIQLLDNENLNDCFVDFGIIRDGKCSSNCFDDSELGDILEPLWNTLKELKFNFNVKPSRKSLYCGLYGDTSFTIDHKGNIYKCWELVGDDNHFMGSLNEEGKISSLNYNFFNWMSRNPLETKECRECKYLPICGGGCGSVAIERHDDIHACGCFKSKSIFDKQIKFYYENKIKLDLLASAPDLCGN